MDGCSISAYIFCALNVFAHYCNWTVNNEGKKTYTTTLESFFHSVCVITQYVDCRFCKFSTTLLDGLKERESEGKRASETGDEDRKRYAHMLKKQQFNAVHNGKSMKWIYNIHATQTQNKTVKCQSTYIYSARLTQTHAHNQIVSWPSEKRVSFLHDIVFW